VRATKVNAGLAESNGKLLLGIWRDSLHVTCGLTACTPGSAPGPTLGNEYGKTLPFFTATPYCARSSSTAKEQKHLNAKEHPVQRLLFQDNLKGKTGLDVNEARDDGVLGWQWHQLNHMQTPHC